MIIRYLSNILLTLFLFSGRCIAQVDSHSDSVYYEGFKKNRGIDINSAARFALQAHSASVVFGHTLFTIKSCNALGYCYERTAKLDSAKYYYLQGINLSVKTNLLDRANFMLNNMGNIFESEARYDSALHYYSRSLSLAEQTNSWEDQAIASNNIGIVYYRLRSMEEALSNFLSAYTIRTEKKINDGLESNLVNIAHCYAYLGNSKKAEEFIKLMLTFCKDNDCDLDTKLDGLHALGKALGKLGKHNEAYDNLSLGYSQASKSSNVFLTTSILLSYAYEELLAGKTDSALFHLNKGYQLSLAKKMPILTLDAFEKYAKLYQRQGDFPKAFDYLTKYSSLKDSIFSEQLNESLKRFAISKQTKIIVTQKAKIDVRQKFILLLALIISIVIIGTAYFYLKFRFTNKTRAYLSKEVDDPSGNEQLENLRKQVKQLEAERDI
jgi:tetratricopeptide (TPR) repeat protein